MDPLDRPSTAAALSAEHGRLIASRRAGTRISQARLAELLGTTQVSVSRWERGAQLVPFELMAPLAQALRVRPTDLFPFDVPVVRR